MTRTPEDLRRMATRCRDLAVTCVTNSARKPLIDMADELERGADAQERLHTPIGAGRY